MSTHLDDVRQATDLVRVRLARAMGSPQLDGLAKPLAGEVVQALSARIEARLRAEINRGCCECCDGQCPTAKAVTA